MSSSSAHMNDQEATLYYSDDGYGSEGDDVDTKQSRSPRNSREGKGKAKTKTIDDEPQHETQDHCGDYLTGYLQLKGAFRWNKRFFRLKRTSLHFYKDESDSQVSL
eukprot:TRINITY_DN1318_c1_g1_i2.p2 TRINITY_DN1318_c1_g1~~TRINITY_DN1318_c1_g1_i2.p2  ORF type:complete len:106 (-),score=18.45 TRINITY_DN1318_c1_g1_i2:544-861(-)